MSVSFEPSDIRQQNPPDAESNPSGIATALAGGKTRSRTGRALVSACVALPLTIFAFETYVDRMVSIQRAIADTDNTAAMFEQHALETFETCHLVANLLNEHVKGIGWDELAASTALHAYLEGLVRQYPRISVLAIDDRDGNVRASSIPTNIVPPSAATRDYFIELRDHAVPLVFGQRVRSRIGGGDHINIAIRRTSPDETFDGVVLVTLVPETFLEFWRQAPTGGQTGIFRLDGRLLAHYPEPPGDILTMQAPPALLAAARSADRGVYRGFSALDDQERFIAFRRINGYPIVIVHAIEVSHALRPWAIRTALNGVIYGIPTLALVVLALRLTRYAVEEREAKDALLSRTGALTAESHRRAKAEADLAAVLRDTVSRQEADRSRIARDVHDILGQHATMLHIGIDRLRGDLDDLDAVRDQAASMKDAATEMTRAIARIARDLRPAALEELGIQTAIQVYTEMIAANHGIVFNLYFGQDGRRLDTAIETTLYRAVQEGVTNILKHAEAKHVDIALEVRPTEVHLVIEDDGKGFANSVNGIPSAETVGLGLLGMRERLALVGGTLDIETQPGKGTTLEIRVPLRS